MKILAVDFGDARTGIAVCDKHEMLASPVCVVFERKADECAKKVAKIISEQKADEIIIGLPLNMDGTKGDRAKLCEDFSSTLSKLTDIPIKMWDERQTTVLAHNYLNQTNTRGKKRKEIVDAVAAVIILENYLEYRKNHS